MLHAGFAHRCITPPPGKDIPGLFEQRLALGVHDHLYVRALVMEEEGRRVAMVQTDAITVPELLVKEAREVAARWCGIAAADCFISATHTHSGGPVFGGFLSDPDLEYPHFVAEQIGAAITEANRALRPALTGAGTDTAMGVAFNRRFAMRDGLQRTHPGKLHPDIVSPAGPEDPRVTVVGFCDPATFRPFGCVVHFACHATHMNGLLYSADYVRWVVEGLQAAYGPEFGVVYLNGACGDITQVDNRDPRPLELGPYWCERTGRVVAGGALQALARLDYAAGGTIARKTSFVRAGIRSSSAAELQAARALLRHRAPTAEDVETIYANERLKVEAMRRKSPWRRLELMGVRVADTLFWGVPGEFFQQFAWEVEVDSPFPHTCCVELANGYAGYICPPEAFAGGGYEIRTARSSFLEPKTGGQLVRGAQGLCRSLYEEARTEVDGLPGRRLWPTYQDSSALDGINQLVKRSGKGTDGSGTSGRRGAKDKHTKKL